MNCLVSNPCLSCCSCSKREAAHFLNLSNPYSTYSTEHKARHFVPIHPVNVDILMKSRTCMWRSRSSQGINKVSITSILRGAWMSVPKVHGNPSSRCWDISVWTECKPIMTSPIGLWTNPANAQVWQSHFFVLEPEVTLFGRRGVGGCGGYPDRMWLRTRSHPKVKICQT